MVTFAGEIADARWLPQHQVDAVVAAVRYLVAVGRNLAAAGEKDEVAVEAEQPAA